MENKRGQVYELSEYDIFNSQIPFTTKVSRLIYFLQPLLKRVLKH